MDIDKIEGPVLREKDYTIICEFNVDGAAHVFNVRNNHVASFCHLSEAIGFIKNDVFTQKLEKILDDL